MCLDERNTNEMNQANQIDQIDEIDLVSLYPQMSLLLKMPYRFNRSQQLLVRNRLCALFDSISLQVLHKEPAMNGTSGFEEVRVFYPPIISKSCLLHEQEPRIFGRGAWTPSPVCS